MNTFANVSVVIPCYNCEKTIIRALDSILYQTLKPKEVILIDDKSKDNSIDVIENYININKDKLNIKLIKLIENSGPSKARNIGWNNAYSKYIAFLDSDDSWHCQKIEIQYTFMEQNPDIYLCSNKYQVIADSQKPEEVNYNGSYEVITKFKCLTKNYFTTPTVILKKEIDFRFDEKKRYSEDYKLWLEIVHNEKKAVRIDTYLTYLYKNEFGESGLSSNNLTMWLSELSNYFYLFNTKKINFFKLTLVYILSFIKFIRRLLIIKIRS